MEDIKRYSFMYPIGDTYIYEETLKTENFRGKYVKYCDHKAVVEALEKDIEVSGKAVEDLIDLVDELKEDKLTMQNKIEELEKRLLKYKGLVKICRGAGECDYDGSTCNDNDNCGEYDPILKEIPKGIK